MAKRAEDNYPKNQENPGPSKESLEEPSDKSAGHYLNWTTIIAVIVLGIVLLIIYMSR